jgi:NADPH:quinone reductase
MGDCPSTMKAVGLRRFGGPEVLEVVEMPVPAPGPGEVRIRVHAAAVNPTDVLFRTGETSRDALRGRRPPYIPGMDIAGVVDEPGLGVELPRGAPVIAIAQPRGRLGGAYAELVVVSARSVARLPRDTDFVHAATLPMNGLTALLAVDLLQLSPGDSVLVTGGAGAVGGHAIGLSGDRGLRVFADAAPADTAIVAGLGADVVVPRGPDLAARLRGQEPAGMDGVIDAAVLGADVLGALSSPGVCVTLRPYAGSIAEGTTVRHVRIAEYAERPEKLAILVGLAETGLLQLRVAKVFPAAQASDAHRLLELGGLRGRIVLDFEQL